MNTTHPPHKNVTIPLRRRGGPSGHGRVGVVTADPAPRQFECPPKADVSRTLAVTAFYESLLDTRSSRRALEVTKDEQTDKQINRSTTQQKIIIPRASDCQPQTPDF